VPEGDRLSARRQFTSLVTAVEAAVASSPPDTSYLDNSEMVLINLGLVRLARGRLEHLTWLLR